MDILRVLFNTGGILAFIFLFLLQEHWVDKNSPLKLMHISSVEGMEDMIDLGELHEKGILRNLYMRYKSKLIYVSRQTKSVKTI